MMETDPVFLMHRRGKIEVRSKVELSDNSDLAMAYTPGVARVSLAVAEEPELAHELTVKANMVAVVTDGTAVLGLGDIGPKGALPVMEGKAMLFKAFGDVDAFPICLDVGSDDELIETVVRLAPTFGGINLEDIAAPRCFNVEDQLRELLDIPVFHDDQHGTAVVALAALRNAAKLADRPLSDLGIVIGGAGAAGVAVAKILVDAGAGNVVATDRKGAIYAGREDFQAGKDWLAVNTNPSKRSGSLSEVLAGADVFIGVSGPNIVTRDDIASMRREPIVFALANPTPEVAPEEIGDLAGVIATGRSDYANQINNVLCFPGMFRGALDSQATTITEGMKLAAAEAIASAVTEDELSKERIVPGALERGVGAAVGAAVAAAAIREGVTRQADLVAPGST